MSRKIFIFAASMVLSLAFLAACATDDSADDVDVIDDDPIGAADDTDTGPVEDDTAIEEDDAVVDELDDEEANGEDDEAAISDDDAAVNGESDDAVVDELDDDEATEDDGVSTEHPADADADDSDETSAGETYQVTLRDNEIEMDEQIEAGEVTLEVTNEGESMHGLAIQQAELDDEEDASGAAGAFIASTTVRPGDSKTITIDIAEGDYIVFCPVGEHREEHDMEFELSVQ
jgi:uncharacterized cupredoxin-like copper-binding protein